MFISRLALTSHARYTEGAPWPMQIADLSLPVAVCEPVTDMQRRGDFLEYVELLHEVRSSCPGSRLAACASRCLDVQQLKLRSLPDRVHVYAPAFLAFSLNAVCCGTSGRAHLARITGEAAEGDRLRGQHLLLCVPALCAMQISCWGDL